MVVRDKVGERHGDVELRTVRHRCGQGEVNRCGRAWRRRVGPRDGHRIGLRRLPVLGGDLDGDDVAAQAHAPPPAPLWQRHNTLGPRSPRNASKVGVTQILSLSIRSRLPTDLGLKNPWGGASVSSGLGSAGASIGHHASVNNVRESAFEAAQRLVPTLASGEFATEVAVAFSARHARLGERRDVERPVQLAVSTAAEAMALDLPARHLKRRRPRVAGVVRARGEATDRSAAPHNLRRQDHADAGDAREGAALTALPRSRSQEPVGRQN